MKLLQILFIIPLSIMLIQCDEQRIDKVAIFKSIVDGNTEGIRECGKVDLSKKVSLDICHNCLQLYHRIDDEKRCKEFLRYLIERLGVSEFFISNEFNEGKLVDESTLAYARDLLENYELTEKFQTRKKMHQFLDSLEVMDQSARALTDPVQKSAADDLVLGKFFQFIDTNGFPSTDLCGYHYDADGYLKLPGYFYPVWHSFQGSNSGYNRRLIELIEKEMINQTSNVKMMQKLSHIYFENTKDSTFYTNQELIIKHNGKYFVDTSRTQQDKETSNRNRKRYHFLSEEQELELFLLKRKHPDEMAFYFKFYTELPFLPRDYKQIDEDSELEAFLE